MPAEYIIVIAVFDSHRHNQGGLKGVVSSASEINTIKGHAFSNGVEVYNVPKGLGPRAFVEQQKAAGNEVVLYTNSTRLGLLFTENGFRTIYASPAAQFQLFQVIEE